MDFNQLMARMRDLDQPASESVAQECGEPMGMTPPMSTPATPPVAPPSMSVNLNAQGMDNIEQMMKLFQKVNPDMMPKTDLPTPSMTNPDMKPMVSKMISLDKPEEAMDGDFSKATTEPDPEIKDVSAAIPSGDDLHKSKKSFSDKPYRGDNPMAVESIKQYLMRRYQEIKES